MIALIFIEMNATIEVVFSLSKIECSVSAQTEHEIQISWTEIKAQKLNSVTILSKEIIEIIETGKL